MCLLNSHYTFLSKCRGFSFLPIHSVMAFEKWRINPNSTEKKNLFLEGVIVWILFPVTEYPIWGSVRKPIWNLVGTGVLQMQLTKLGEAGMQMDLRSSWIQGAILSQGLIPFSCLHVTLDVNLTLSCCSRDISPCGRKWHHWWQHWNFLLSCFFHST